MGSAGPQFFTRKCEGAGHRKDGWLHGRVRKRMIPLGHTARDLQVDELIRPRVASHQGVDEASPLVVIQWIGDSKFGERSPQASPMLWPPKGHSRVDWDDLVHAIAKNESPVEHRDGRGRKR